ncbi:hypothetical protein [Xanthocytophaga agilis]|uniref:Uncharacterized protein n=1 Tax=Xanthocytophaga agilis TaxID=3048010 RepID=A0AAE3R1J9_9BACT|nr:hypothetical protein [Xanthocytophaga agilis]MDJ1501966.1 hypothetical protein [Xanthocytophaga agilis]
MKQLFSIILFIAFSLVFNAQKEQYAYFKFDQTKEPYLPYFVRINDDILSYDKKVHKVKINPQKLDILVFVFNRIELEDSDPYSYIVKFRPGETYIIKSKYPEFDLYPVSGKKQGFVRFAKTNISDSLVVSKFGNVFQDTVKTNGFTKYKAHPKTAFHHEVIFYKLSELNERTPRTPPLDSMYILFLHGEYYSVMYDGKLTKLLITLDPSPGKPK